MRHNNYEKDNTIGVEVKKIREEMGLSQESMGLLLGVSWHTVQRWETGVYIPSKLNKQKISCISKKYVKKMGANDHDLEKKQLSK